MDQIDPDFGIEVIRGFESRRRTGTLDPGRHCQPRPRALWRWHSTPSPPTYEGRCRHRSSFGTESRAPVGPLPLSVEQRGSPHRIFDRTPDRPAHLHLGRGSSLADFSRPSSWHLSWAVKRRRPMLPAGTHPPLDPTTTAPGLWGFELTIGVERQGSRRWCPVHHLKRDRAHPRSET